MTKKKRIPISSDTATEVLFLSNRTCCVCNIIGKGVQIHHIDEDPSNNDLENLAVLCFDCHDDTMIKGGFARKLDAQQVARYRQDWIDRVKERRKRADEIASIYSLTGATPTTIENDKFAVSMPVYPTYDDPGLLKKYIDQILVIHQAQLMIAQLKWNSGRTVEMNQGSSDMVDFYSEVLSELAAFYPVGHFNSQLPSQYFSEIVSSRYLWHRLALEPKGGGSGGTIISNLVGGRVMFDLKEMIIEMVGSLLTAYSLEDEVNIKKWREKWLR